MKILITGSDGFVGKYFTRMLKVEGHEVHGVDLKTGVDCFELFKVKDPPRYDLIIHLAALVEGIEIIENQPLRVGTDLALDSLFFKWASDTGQSRVVYFSSAAAYPTDLQQTPGYKLQEDDVDFELIGRPDLMYGWSKLTGEILSMHARSTGMNVHVVRPLNILGKGQSLNYPVAAFLDRIEKQEDPFTIWGTGHQCRDYLYAEDVVKATMRMVEEDIPGPINLCTGIATSLNELAKTMFTIADWEPKEIQRLVSKPVGCKYRVGDPTKMLDFYSPQYSVEEALEKIMIL